MELYIDTSSAEKIVIGLDNERFETDARQEKSQKLLPFIDETLRKKKKSMKDIKSIQVNTGPGSFTGLRVGVSVANTIGWVLDVKVNGKDVRKGEIVDINYEKEQPEKGG
jgi:tRNA threonylcarbamoyladenosine biosynthesis protein TsaB